MCDEAIGLIDWDSQGKAARLCIIQHRQWVSTFVSGWCVIGKTMRQRGEWVTSSCPRCNHRKRETTHVLDCKAAVSITEWEVSTVHMKEWMDSHNSCPDLRKLIIKTMQPILYTSDYDFDWMDRLLDCQGKIGCHSFWDR